MRSKVSFAVGLVSLIPGTLLAYDLRSDGVDYGSLSGGLKLMHIASAKNNAFDPSEGTAFLATLKYTSPQFHGLQFAAGEYITADFLGLTDFEPEAGKERLARGMFMNAEGDLDTQLGELYVTYQGESWDAKLGRGLLDTPLTKNAYSMTPNFYTAATVSVEPLDKLSFQLGQITEMSFGARAATDWGLIGEATPTAGAVNPLRPGLGQGSFHPISEVAAGPDAPDTNGITLLNVSYNGIENVSLSAWNYYAEDIANSFYLQGDWQMPIKSLKSKLKLSGQYLYQNGVGDEITRNTLSGTDDDDSLDYNLIGAKISLGNKKWSVYAAANSSGGDTYFYNAFGGDPAFTSTIFSRNAYRENVDAYKVGGSYSPMKGLKFMLHYADYGQSDTLGYNRAATSGAQTDAKELDLVAVYKPRKNLVLKAFFAKRTSEYKGLAAGPGGPDKEQAHLRLVGSYTF